MNQKRLLLLLSLVILLALGLGLFLRNDRGSAPFPQASTGDGAVQSGAAARTALASEASQAIAASAAKVIPRPVATIPARPGVRRVPTASDAVLAGAAGPIAMPLAADFLEKILDASGTRAHFALPDGRAAAGGVQLMRRDADGVLLVQGRLTEPESGFYFFQRQTVAGVAGALVGNVRFEKSELAFRVDPTGPGGTPVLAAHRLDQVVCLNLEAPDTARITENAPQDFPINIPIPAYQNGIVPLQSLPGALGVIYLDFDGEPGPFTGWSSVTTDAAPSGASNAQIKDVWQRVAEDYQPFNINVTTDRRVFDNAPQGSRQHCLLTPTTSAAPGAGGVSYIGSFNNSGDTVNWSFYSTGKAAAEVVSHECGHALGLNHDGRVTPSEGYYGGHGSGETGWAPIMGVGYYQNLVQWSKGEYTSANNTEDDLAIIDVNNNNVAYRADDYGATLATAGYLEIFPNNSVSNEGIMETRADVDAFRFTTSGGAVSLTATTVNAGPNLDILAEIYNSANVLVAANNPDLALSATVSATLAAGDYTLRVSGVGRGAPLVDGYSDYDSLGAYLLSGTVANGVKPDRFAIAENTVNGTAVGTVAPRVVHDANPLVFAITSGNTGGAFAIDPVTGVITVATSSQLNYEALSLRWDDPATFELFISITDGVNAALNESIRVVVTVSDVNETPVVSGGGAFTILEHARVGTLIRTMSATDPDRFDVATFAITAGNTGGTFAIDAVTGKITVVADIEATMQPLFTLTVQATDQGTPAISTSTTLTITVINIPDGYIPGAVIRTFFENITGSNVSNLTGNANFPNNPNSQVMLSSFDSGIEHGDNYGSTVRGYLIPPTTGSYTFWISSDDASELRVSTNATPASAVSRATVGGFTNRYQWNANASQQSVAIALIAGTPYYIEARHKEGTGGDHVEVAWQGPGITQQVIPGAYLTPYNQNYAPVWVAAPYTFSAAQNAPNGTLIGTVSGTDLNGDPLAYSIVSGNTGGAFAIDAVSGVITVANNAALVGGQNIVLQLRVQDNATTPLSATTTATISVLQVLDLISPTSSVVNIPSGVGIFIETGNSGRTGTTLAWTKASGPGTVTFDNTTTLATGATFSANGSYVLRCTETGGTNPIALDVTVNVGVPDYGLTGAKVGAQVIAPSHTVSAGAYTISAAGVGIPSSATPDDFYFINAAASGNMTVTARVVSVQDVATSSSRAGVMIRESLAEDAREAFCGVTAANGGRFIYRATPATVSANATATVAQPYWVRLIRSGNSFTAQIAADSGGAPGAFTAIGSAQTIAMSSDVFVGIAGSSGSATAAGSIVIDNVTIAPSPANIGATVDAGANGSVTFPANAALSGTVSDDAKPAPPGAVTTTWSKFSGAGAVTFGDASALGTTAGFSFPGSYVLRLTANDGAVKTFDNVAITAISTTTVTVTASDASAGEQGPNTGQFTFTRSGSTVGTLTVNFTVSGTASSADYAALPTSVIIPDGLSSVTILVTPIDDALVEGPETVVITLAGGFYNIGVPSSATVTIADNDVVPMVTITSPTIAAVNVPAGTGLVLESTATDDGLPSPLAFAWSKVSGPGTVTYGPANTANTAANFSAAGTYVLRLTANDGQFSNNAELTVNYGIVDNALTGAKVGAQAVQPSHTLSSGTYNVSAAGAGIPSTSTPDDFYFLNTAVTGDVTITARLVSVQAVNGSSSRAGVMIRNSLAADSIQAFCAVNSAGSGRWIYRATAATNSANSQAAAAFPYWVRIIRSGSTFTAQFAPNSGGAPGAWTTAGTAQTLAMGSSVFVGLAATSGSTAATGAAVFDNVTITPTPVNIAASVNAGIDATITLPATVALDGTVTDDGKPAAFTTAWSKVSGPGAVEFGNAAAIDTTANFAAAGTHTLRLTANDGQVKTFDDVAVTVLFTPIEQWRQSHFGANAGNPTIAGDLADPDFDGLSNLLEYALALDPLVPGSTSVVADVETIGADKFLRLTVTRNSAATDVSFGIEVTGDLTTPSSWGAAGTTIEANTATLLRARDNTPFVAPASRNIRLKVTHP